MRHLAERGNVRLKQCCFYFVMAFRKSQRWKSPEMLCDGPEFVQPPLLWQEPGADQALLAWWSGSLPQHFFSCKWKIRKVCKQRSIHWCCLGLGCSWPHVSAHWCRVQLCLQEVTWARGQTGSRGSRSFGCFVWRAQFFVAPSRQWWKQIANMDAAENSKMSSKRWSWASEANMDLRLLFYFWNNRVSLICRN